LQVIHHPAHAVHLAVNPLVGGRIRGQHPIHQSIQRSFDHRQWRAQFMRHVADQFLAHIFNLLKLGCHPVEAHSQLTQFIL